jgi:hypothetical protein
LLEQFNNHPLFAHRYELTMVLFLVVPTLRMDRLIVSVGPLVGLGGHDQAVHAELPKQKKEKIS